MNIYMYCTVMMMYQKLNKNRVAFIKTNSKENKSFFFFFFFLGGGGGGGRGLEKSKKQKLVFHCPCTYIACIGRMDGKECDKNRQQSSTIAIIDKISWKANLAFLLTMVNYKSVT